MVLVFAHARVGVGTPGQMLSPARTAAMKAVQDSGVNVSVPPSRSLVSRTCTRPSTYRTSTHEPLLPLLVLLRQVSSSADTAAPPLCGYASSPRIFRINLIESALLSAADRSSLNAIV